MTGLTKRYPDLLALDAVSFEVRADEVLGLIGPNGSGKTTLLEVVSGLLPADAGEVFIDGRPLPPERRHTALFYLPDGIAPYAEHTVRDVLGFVAGVYRRPKPMIDRVIDSLALGPMLAKRVGALSKGFRRRLLLAVGLLTPHPMLMMDEPFDGLDLRQTREVMAHLRETAGNGRTLLLSIHQLIDAERMCNRFVLLSAGQVRGEGTIDDLRAQAGMPNGGLEELFLELS